MRTLNASDFAGHSGFAVHTGMQHFSGGARWTASAREEGLLLSEDGTLTCIVPGCTLRIKASARHDLFVFQRGASLSGRIGAGGICAPDGSIYGCFGEFSCTLLQPRRALKFVQAALDAGLSPDRLVGNRLRPALQSAMESALRAGTADLRREAERLSIDSMHETCLLMGLSLNRLNLEWMGRTEN